MTTKTRHCDECKHLYYWVGADEYQCLKLHKPRFYKPAREGDLNWGWKRKCEDFKPKDAHDHPTDS